MFLQKKFPNQLTGKRAAAVFVILSLLFPADFHELKQNDLFKIPKGFGKLTEKD